MRSLLRVAACLVALAASPVHAATIQKIDKARTKVMINLTKDEIAKLKVGDRIAIKDEQGLVQGTGTVAKLKKTQAIVNLDRAEVVAGMKVSVAPAEDPLIASMSGGGGASAAMPAKGFGSELELASMPYASLFTDDGEPGADDTTLDTDSLLPLSVNSLGLRFFMRFGDFALGPEVAYLKHDLKVSSTITQKDVEGAEPTESDDKLAVTMMQAGFCMKYEWGLSGGSHLGFVPRLCFGYLSKSGKSVNLNYKDSGSYLQAGPGFYYKFGQSVGLGVSLDYHSTQITATALSTPKNESGSTTATGEVELKSKETRTHMGIGYSLFFLF